MCVMVPVPDIIEFSSLEKTSIHKMNYNLLKYGPFGVYKIPKSTNPIYSLIENPLAIKGSILIILSSLTVADFSKYFSPCFLSCSRLILN